MMPGAASRRPGWRARVVTVVIAVAALCLLAAGCGGTQPPASGVPRPSPGSTSVSPARPLPATTMTTPGDAPATAASRTPSSPVTAPAGPVFQASTSALTAAMRARMTGVSWHPGCPVDLEKVLTEAGSIAEVVRFDFEPPSLSEIFREAVRS